jgi:hypothetical protein
LLVLGVVRHSRGRLGRRQERIEALACDVLATGDEVPVAVPRLADIAVAGPGRNLLPVESGGMKYEIAQCRASWGVSGSSPACFHALFARARIVEA